MIIHLLSGFLGSGKTTTIRQACRELVTAGKTLGVITNDQGVNIVDSRLFAYMQVPQKQVGNGCFCCNYDEFDSKLKELTDTFNPDIIFAESVGTCTDLVATVMKPLIQFNAAVVTISTIADAQLLHTTVIEQKKTFAEDVEYILFKQLEEAEVVVVNKTDLLSERDLSALQRYLKNTYPSKEIIYQNALATGGVKKWLDVLNTQIEKECPLRSLEINYDKYAAGEAMLAYFDGEFEIETGNNNAEEAAYDLWNEIVDALNDHDLPIGHLKCWLNGNQKISITSTTSERPHINFLPGRKSRLLINARVQTNPLVLGNIIATTIALVSAEKHYNIIPVEKSSFSPGYPKPLHRIST